MKLFSFLFILFIGLFFLIPSANAQTCGVFQKRVNDTCIKFAVPSNAHLTYSGNSWDCNRGFRMSEDKSRCEEIRIPTNATANTTQGFYCNSGFERVGDTCLKAKPIENGKFYEFGANFYCNKGYKRNEETKTCDKIIIPENAFEDSTSLDGWNCFSEYLKQGEECKKFDLPEHGFWFHNYWGCEPGYRKNLVQKNCEKISIPENSHSTDTFDGWVCNSGFTKNYNDNKCDKSN